MQSSHTHSSHPFSGVQSSRKKFMSPEPLDANETEKIAGSAMMASLNKVPKSFHTSILCNRKIKKIIFLTFGLVPEVRQ